MLFLGASEQTMVDKLAQAKIEIRRVHMDTSKRIDLTSSIGGWVAEDANLKFLAQKAFITSVRAYYLQKDKEVFDVTALPLEEYAAALGLPGAPKIRFVKTAKKLNTKNKRGPDAGSIDENADAAKKQRGDKIARLMKRRNTGVLDPYRAGLMENQASGGSDGEESEDDFMTLKREDHGLTADAGEEETMSEQKELKKMSRKQRREEKQRQRNLELGELIC